jgi:hypothetical protein
MTAGDRGLAARKIVETEFSEQRTETYTEDQRRESPKNNYPRSIAVVAG